MSEDASNLIPLKEHRALRVFTHKSPKCWVKFDDPSSEGKAWDTELDPSKTPMAFQ